MAAARPPGNRPPGNQLQYIAPNTGRNLSDALNIIKFRFTRLKEARGLTYHEAISILNGVFNPTNSTSTRLTAEQTENLQRFIIKFKELQGTQNDIERVLNEIYPEAAKLEPGAPRAADAAAASNMEPGARNIGGRRKHRTRRNKKHRTRRNKKHRTRKH